MPKTMLEKLVRIRELTQRIRTKQAEYKNMLPALAPIKLDGLPHRSSEGDGMEELVDARAEMETRIWNMAKELTTLQYEVKPFVDALPERLHTFAMNYYYDSNDMENVAVIMGKGKSTLYKYNDEIRKLGEKVG